MTRLVDVLRDLVDGGIGIAPAGADRLGVYPPRSSSPPALLPPQLRAALKKHKVALRRLVAVDAVRQGWRIPIETPINVQWATILAWLLAERLTFTRLDYRCWLELKTEHIDAGASRYVADILATEAVAREQLRSLVVSAAVVWEAA